VNFDEPAHLASTRADSHESTWKRYVVSLESADVIYVCELDAPGDDPAYEQVLRDALDICSSVRREPSPSDAV